MRQWSWLIDIYRDFTECYDNVFYKNTVKKKKEKKKHCEFFFDTFAHFILVSFKFKLHLSVPWNSETVRMAE